MTSRVAGVGGGGEGMKNCKSRQRPMTKAAAVTRKIPAETDVRNAKFYKQGRRLSVFSSFRVAEWVAACMYWRLARKIRRKEG